MAQQKGRLLSGRAVLFIILACSARNDMKNMEINRP